MPAPPPGTRRQEILQAQVRDLEKTGCNKVFVEELSSVAATRPQLEAALEWVREGDVLVVTKLDRLARSVADLVAITATLRKKGVALRVLSMNLDTGTPTGKLMVNLLGSIAEFERELMLERQREGIAKAKAGGKVSRTATDGTKAVGRGDAPQGRREVGGRHRKGAEDQSGKRVPDHCGECAHLTPLIPESDLPLAHFMHANASSFANCCPIRLGACRTEMRPLRKATDRQPRS